MTDEITTNEYKHINYRLDNIDRQLVDLKGVLTEIALFRKDLGSLLASSTIQENRIDEIEKHDISTDNHLKQLDNATSKMSSKMNEYSDRLHVVEQKPIKDKAQRWQQILDYIFKMMLVAIAALVAAKIGISL